jgi:hypothetical protein
MSEMMVMRQLTAKHVSCAIGVGLLLAGAVRPAAAQQPWPDPQANPVVAAPFSDGGDAPVTNGGVPDPAPDLSVWFSPDFAFEVERQVRDAVAFEFNLAGAPQDPKPAKFPKAPAPPAPPLPPLPPIAFGGADSLYEDARNLIDRERYDQAVKRLNELLRQFDGKAQAIENRVDAALYWKAYTLGKQQDTSDALNTIADMQNRFAESRWLKDAKALEVELRQASGQAVSPDSQNDEELKLLALRGLMRSDPDRAVPMIDQLLAGNSSVNVKENALFVLSQSQSARAKEIITSTAKNSTNPDVQLRAVRYLGAMGGTDNRQTLDEIYRTSTDTSIKRAILRAFMVAGDRPRLLSIAKSESSPELRGEAVQQLGMMHADTELSDLYQNESNTAIKTRIIQAMFSSGNVDKMTDVARTEKDVQLRRSAIRSLGMMNAARTSDTLRAMYASESAPEIRKEIINALYLQKNAPALVEMARAEKDPTMKKEIVTKLSTMRSKEATDYMLELLK